MSANPIASDQSPGLAQHQWILPHLPALTRYALMRLRQRQDAEDAVHDTVLAAIRGQASFRGASQQRTWLIGILRNKIADRLQTLARDPETNQEFDAQHWTRLGKWRMVPGRWAEDPEAASERGELRRLINFCLAALPVRTANALLFRLVDGMEASETAATLAVTPGNLAVLLHRARLRMRDCLERQGLGQTP